MFFGGLSDGVNWGVHWEARQIGCSRVMRKMNGAGRGGTARSLRCATFLFTNLLDGDGTFAYRIRVMKANQYIIHRVL